MSTAAERAKHYARWIKDDCRDLIAQIDRPVEDQRQILLDARANVKAALELIEHRLQTQETA